LKIINGKEDGRDDNANNQKIEPKIGCSEIITDRKQNIKDSNYTDDQVVIGLGQFCQFNFNFLRNIG
jgi:hypothetical protein